MLLYYLSFKDGTCSVIYKNEDLSHEAQLMSSELDKPSLRASRLVGPSKRPTTPANNICHLFQNEAPTTSLVEPALRAVNLAP